MTYDLTKSWRTSRTRAAEARLNYTREARTARTARVFLVLFYQNLSECAAAWEVMTSFGMMRRGPGNGPGFLVLTDITDDLRILNSQRKYSERQKRTNLVREVLCLPLLAVLGVGVLCKEDFNNKNHTLFVSLMQY